MSNSLFQVDLQGVLKVLSNSLYGSYQVFIRELLQNSVDAIHARKHIEEFKPSIAVSFTDDQNSRILIVEDNGIGLTLEEVDEFLSKIGSSSKSSEANRDSFIGQFGIGLLSCFMVSDEVTILSSSAKTGECIKWVGNINGTYHKELLQQKIETGTRVFLKINKKVLLDVDLLETLLHKYGDYLPFPIHFIYQDSPKNEFSKLFPWENQTLNDSALRLGMETFKEDFFSFIPLKDRSGKTRGIAYIIPRHTHFGTVNAHKVYVKRMFITDKSPEILPDWAFFVRAIINSENLSPTASREDIYKNDTLEEVKQDLGDCIKEYLINLGKTNPDTLNKILRIHNEALKSLALKDHDFFNFIAPWFVFPTSEGNMNLIEIKKKTNTILYVSDIDQFRQILPVARANNQLIINGGYIYDTQILETLGNKDKTRLYQLVDVEYYGNILTDLPIETYDMIRNRLLELQYHMEEFRCELEVKIFAPESLPAIFYMSQQSILDRDIRSIKEESDDIWSEVTDSIYNFNAEYHSKLFLNFRNPMISKLLNSTKSDTDQLFTEMIYVNALMLGHYPLNQKELDIMNNNLLQLLQKIL